MLRTAVALDVLTLTKYFTLYINKTLEMGQYPRFCYTHKVKCKVKNTVTLHWRQLYIGKGEARAAFQQNKDKHNFYINTKEILIGG